MATAMQTRPEMEQIVREAMEAFRNDSSYTADMVAEARRLEGRRSRLRK